MPSRSAVTRILATPENRAALVAIEELLRLLAEQGEPGLLYLHGPPGAGKSTLVRKLVEDAIRQEYILCEISANDFAEAEGFEASDHARDADVLIIEDLHHLPVRFAAALIALVDDRLAQGRAVVVTALVGPAQLSPRGESLPRRLTSRLAAGLVVGIEPMSAPSRRRLLDQQAEEARVRIEPAILDWLASHLTGGGRQLEGAMQQLRTLQRLQKKPLRLDEVQGHFQAQIEAATPSVERITEHVGACYRVHPRQLRSAKRTREVMLPRQLSMYLARQLTKLSLEQIGQYFGGRDHKTVQHACQKVEAAIKSDRVFSGIVRRIHAELT